MYASDHNPPHFHVVANDWAVMIGIESLKRIEGKARPAAYSAAVAWAKANRELLRAKWKELNT